MGFQGIQKALKGASERFWILGSFMRLCINWGEPGGGGGVKAFLDVSGANRGDSGALGKFHSISGEFQQVLGSIRGVSRFFRAFQGVS